MKITDEDAIEILHAIPHSSYDIFFENITIGILQ